MKRGTIEAFVERTSRSIPATSRDMSAYGVARLVGDRTEGHPLDGSTYVLARLEDPHRSEVILRESECVPVPQLLGPDEALLAPPLALALLFWDQLHLELGEAAIYTGGDPLADLVGQVAVWRGGSPVIRLGSDPGTVLPKSVEILQMTDSDEAMHHLRSRIKEKPGFAAVDLSGRPETIDLLLEVVPRWGRLMLAGRTLQPITVDFYNNVHRKGVLLASSVLDVSRVFGDSVSRDYLAAAFRILLMKEMAAVCSELASAKSLV